MAQLLLTFLGLVLAYGAAVIVYRTFVSPLRSVPGPLLGRFSTAWHLWHTLKGDYHIAIRDVHSKYGEFHTLYVKKGRDTD